MNKKQIVILIVVGILIFCSTFLGVYFIKNRFKDKPPERIKDVVQLKDYTLKFGTYIGTEEEYDFDNEKTVKKKRKIVLTKDTINNESYYVKDNTLYVGSQGNNSIMYEVTANNEFTLLAGAGIDYKLEEGE